jgi:hypothetical protein
MSYHTYFDLASGLAKPLQVPPGTQAWILSHIARVEAALKLTTVQHLKTSPKHWDTAFEWPKAIGSIDNKMLCDWVSKHNKWVRWIYERFAFWSNHPVKDGETITPKDAIKFWHGLRLLWIDPEHWSAYYYREQMEALYDAMRGRPTAGITFDPKALTVDQAAAVIVLFSEFLDTHDVRLDVPVGYDSLASSSEGEFAWSSTCGAIHENDLEQHARKCRKKKCDVRQEHRSSR